MRYKLIVEKVEDDDPDYYEEEIYITNSPVTLRKLFIMMKNKGEWNFCLNIYNNKHWYWVLDDNFTDDHFILHTKRTKLANKLAECYRYQKHGWKKLFMANRAPKSKRRKDAKKN